jgi:hypothetical protein
VEAEGVDVTVRVSAEVAGGLLGTSPATRASDALAAICARCGTALRPMHAHARDASLGRWFVARAPDARAAQALADRLRRVPEVEAAYVKPAATPP